MDNVLELEIRPGTDPGSYVVQVMRSVGGGEPTASFSLDLDALVEHRPQLEESILASAVMARRVVPTTEAAIQRVGRQLFDAVFQGDVHSAYRTSVAVASERGKSIQLVLRLSAPGLVALPWETLFDPETGTYLCRKEPLVRRVPARHAPAALAIDPPLRILGMVSSPRGLPALDVEAEKALLEDALRPQIDAGRVTISWVDPVTWSAVHDQLLSREWHVLHFIGHGTYDTETDEGLLAFVGREGRAHNVPASSLADLIDEADPSPRLVLLNTCSSGAGGRDDLFSGTAGALAQSGIHAVAAMQFEISDKAAIEFSRGFYSALAHGRSIDDAVRSGRIEILGLGQGTLEWVTPVLYLRGDDTRLFEVAPVAETGMVTRTDAASGPVSVPTGPQPTSEVPAPEPVLHAADSGDVPSTFIPILRSESTPIPTMAGRDAPPPGVDSPGGPEPTDASTTPAGRSRRSLSRAMRGLIIGVIAVLGLVVIGTIIALTLNQGSDGVPPVADKTWDEAKTILQEEGYMPEKSFVADTTETTESVLWTEPRAGTSVEEGKPVTVYVSSGTQTLTVPDVSGSTFDAASERLEGYDNTPEQAEAADDVVEEGLVVRTEPAAGTGYTPGTQIKVYVSTGPAPDTGGGDPGSGGTDPDATPTPSPKPVIVDLPDYLGRNVDEAASGAEALGMPTRRVAGGPCEGEDAVVVSQSPAPGPVEVGTQVVLTYCTSPQ
ncbi:MAG TPA: PASTA domain-containing protein [Agromyces sp.]|jgi:beta-lactam-binding protein with PASTA domain